MCDDLAFMLALWEAAEDGAPRGRAARLLEADGEAAPAALPLGTAARRLLGLRAKVLGDGMVCIAACQACGAMNEAKLDAAALAATPADPAPVRVEAEGWRAEARQPTLADLELASACPDVEGAAALLCDRVLLALAPPAGVPPDATPPAALTAALEEALDAADGLADARIGGRCVACGGAWEVALDAAAFLGAELGVQARRRLGEVAALARAFGWSEAEILALPPARRRAYLQLAE